MIASSASATGSPTTLSDQYALIKGGQDEYVGWQIMVNSAGTVAADYAKRFVTASSAGILTLSAALAATTVAGNAYELWKPPYSIEQINNLIAQAEKDVTTQVFVDKNDATTYTESARYTYNIPSGFVALNKIEYVQAIDKEVIIDDCDQVWDESVDADVTASIDSTLERGSKPSLKLVVTAAATTNDILATNAISTKDIRACTHVELSVYSSVTLAASTLQLLLDNTASCVSPLETLNFPAVSAASWTRMALALTAQQSDTAIISVGVKMPIDPGAFTVYLRRIRAVDDNSRRYEKLRPEYWKIISGSTNYIKLEDDGMDIVGEDTLLRLNGYQNITVMSSETTASQVDPQYLVDLVSSQILLSHNPTPADAARGNALVAKAEDEKRRISTSLRPGTRWF